MPTAATEARKLKQTSGEACDRLKIKSPTEELNGRPRGEALKDKLASQPDDDDMALALKTAMSERLKGAGKRGRRDKPATGGAE